MSETILGISAFHHDSAAAIVYDGEIIAAAQEERFSRRKRDSRFPKLAIDYCMEEAFIEADEIDAVVFYEQPWLTLDRVVKSLLSVAPRGERQWLQAASSVLGCKLLISQYIRRVLGAEDDLPVLFTRHHLSHAAAAFYPSPFEEAAILTLDGVGEWASTGLAVGRGTQIEALAEIHYPHSLGLLYSTFTEFCGFDAHSGEQELMGLASHGESRYADRIRQHLFQQRSDGSFRLDTRCFGFLDSDRMTNPHFHALFDGPPRRPDAPITRREIDLAASVQEVIEDSILSLARDLRQRTAVPNLCLAGGVALNCVANGLLQRQKIFDRLWIQPAAGDAGAALGAALYASHGHFDIPRRRRKSGRDSQKGSYLGPAFSSSEIRAFVDRHGYPHRVIQDRDARFEEIAGALEQGHVVGFFSGRMEFGPHALGGRSILGDPRRIETQTRLNAKVKGREAFHPIAASVLAEKAGDYFDLDGESPYMLQTVPVTRSRRRSPATSDADEDDLVASARQIRSDIPAVTHVDTSARVQTVHAADHADFHALIAAFEGRSGCPVVANTSFNVGGEPTVRSPEDAYRCFMRTDMDLLVLEDYLLLKEEQPPWAEESSSEGDSTSSSESLDGRDGAGHGAARQLHSDGLIGAAESLRQRGIRFFDQGSDAEASTWYSTPAMGPDIVSYEAGDCGEQLREMWREQGLDELADLAPRLYDLAKDMAEE